MTTLSCDQLKDLVDSMPSAFELGELLTAAERPRFIGYKFLPDEAIRAAFEIAKARGEPDFGFAAVEAYLDEVERLKPLTELVQAFEGVKMHLEDHLARLRSPAAQETLAEYASLQGRARIRGDAKLRQQIARLADLIPPAGDHRPSQREKSAPTPAPAELAPREVVSGGGPASGVDAGLSFFVLRPGELAARFAARPLLLL